MFSSCASLKAGLASSHSNNACAGFKNQRHSEWIARHIPMIDRLFRAVVENMKILLREIENLLTSIIQHGYWNNHFVAIDADFLLRNSQLFLLCLA
jgi:hypothetical protein